MTMRKGYTGSRRRARDYILFFSKRVHLLLEIRQEGGTIRFRDLAAESFTRYKGTWRVSTERGKALVGYERSAAPAFAVAQMRVEAFVQARQCRNGHTASSRNRPAIARVPRPRVDQLTACGRAWTVPQLAAAVQMPGPVYFYTMQPGILIVDDEQLIRWSLGERLAKAPVAIEKSIQPQIDTGSGTCDARRASPGGP
jgi:hypothetical protein